ncbi:tyramine oxidase subunit B [Arthrobacter globiformis]|uniref:tyramine oxidase subunit B n=1 Tax=Arthrobacter globiformis TaxID=1665 RepID=UPI0027D8A438|nr:tyramine oxidase subunit B [Arthrobacter globiformis]
MSTLPHIDFIYLSEPDMIRAGVTDMHACVDAMEQMFALLAVGDYRMAGENNDSHGSMVTFPKDSPFPNMPTPTEDRRFMAMPAYLGGDFQTTGVKWYGSNIENRQKGLPRSILMFTLNDTDTGAPLAFMSANLLSAYRTGAVPGVGARHFARKDSRVVGVAGPGVMAKTTLLSFVDACPLIDTLKIKGRGAESLRKFQEWVREELPQITTIEVVDTFEDVVRGSDLVTFCTTGTGAAGPEDYPTIKREWVKPGAFFGMPSLCNVEDSLLEKDVTKVVDARGLYEAWFHDLPAPSYNHIPLIGQKWMDLVQAGALDRDELVDIADVVAGTKPGRQSEDEIVIMSVGGMPIEDVAWGTKVYRNAVRLGLGQSLNLWSEPALA